MDDGTPLTHGDVGRLSDILEHILPRNVAQLYTWHSFRSGLATALHAAGVPDSMVQLMCRWTCPESLDLYRRKGLVEGENYLRAAKDVRVDAIQAVNVPRVCADADYATAHEHFANPKVASAYAAHTDKTVNATPRQLTLSAKLRRATKQPAPPVPTHRPTLVPLQQPPKRGETAFVPASVWPDYVCAEHDGVGWQCKILHSHAGCVEIAFVHARDDRGQPYEDEWLAWDTLRQEDLRVAGAGVA